jgi:hypothetical protein
MKKRLLLAVCTLLLLNHFCAAQITITFPNDRAVFQRDHNKEATVYIAGYITAPFTKIEARFIPIVTGEGVATPAGGGWAVVENNPTGGNFYGSMVVPGGWYKLEVRGVRANVDPVVTSLAHVGVGEVFVVAGQSNATGGDGNANGPGASHDQVNSVNFQNYTPNTNTISPYSDIQIPCPVFVPLSQAVKTAPFGNYAWCWGSFGDKIYEKLHVPVMIFNSGWSSTAINNWQETVDPNASTISPFGYTFPKGLPFGHLRVALNYYAAQLGVRAVLWHQGESDNYLEKGGSSSVDWFDRYRSKLWSVIQGSRNVSGKSDLAWVVARASRFDYPLNDPSHQTTVSANVINAQNELINNNAAYPHVYQGPDTDPYYSIDYRGDEIHFRGDGITTSPDGHVYSGLISLAGFWADKITDDFINESVPYSATPPPHVITTQASGSTTVTFTAPGNAQTNQFNWFMPDNNCNQYVNTSQQWTASAGTYQLKMLDANQNTVLSPKLYVSGVLPLPVTWMYFTGQTSENNRPVLKWATSSETNASHFEVERSTDARSFGKITSLTAAGNSKNATEYSFTDDTATPGNFYYRLKQVDRNGDFDYSRIINVKVDGRTLVRIYPNPVVNKLTIEPATDFSSVEIANLTGVKIHQATYYGKMIELEMGHFPSGLYTVKVNGDTFKVIK